MCEIYHTRKSPTKVYIEFTDDKEDLWAVRKLPIQKYEWARKFNNPDFLVTVASPTSDRDFNDSATAVEFRDDCWNYAE